MKRDKAVAAAWQPRFTTQSVMAFLLALGAALMFMLMTSSTQATTVAAPGPGSGGQGDDADNGQDETEVRRQCATRGGDARLRLRDEGQSIRVIFSLHDMTPGSRWLVSMRHGGGVVLRIFRRANLDGDLRVRIHVRDMQGADRVQAWAQRNNRLCFVGASLQ